MTQKSLDHFNPKEPKRSEPEVVEAPKPTIEPKELPKVSEPLLEVSDVALWSDIHHPRSVSEIVGHESELQKIQTWFSTYRKRDKPLFLHGPTGTGKTSLIYALADDNDLEVVEMNASDFRTSALIEEKIGHAMKQRTLLQKKGKLILVDEIDGLYGTSDRGGVPTLIKLMHESVYPVILTANDSQKQSLKALKKKCKVIAFDKIDLRFMAARLKEIALKEKIQVEDSVLNELARRSDGDLRAAINDLQMLSQVRRQIVLADLEHLSSREKEVQILETLLAIFKTKDYKHIMKSIWDSDKNPDELLLWLAENIPKEYEKSEEVARAYDALSRADMFRGRIVHNQAWSLMKYVSERIGFGVAAAKNERYSKVVDYRFPGIIAKMGRSKFTRATRDSVALKIGEKTHTSKRRAIEHFPYYAQMLRKGSLGFELTPEELEFLN